MNIIKERNPIGQLRIEVGKLIFETFKDNGCVQDDCQVCHWRWHVKARNNKLVATSGESFHDKYNAERAMKGFLQRLGL